MGIMTELRSGYAAVNGLNLYYEIHGAGRPLIVLHGGLGSTAMFLEILPALTGNRQVVAVDLQAHGRTADIDRPLSYQLMADDMAALIAHLGLDKADFMGYSLGGAVALRAAIQHPQTVGKLVLISVPLRRNGWYPEVLAAMAQIGPASAEMMKPSPIYAEYARVAPRPDDFPQLLAKMGTLLRQDYDWSSDLSALKAPPLLVFGDNDAVRPAHIVEFFQLLGGGQKDAGWDRSGMSAARLAILPGVTHYDILSSSVLPAAVVPFLDAK